MHAARARLSSPAATLCGSPQGVLQGAQEQCQSRVALAYAGREGYYLLPRPPPSTHALPLAQARRQPRQAPQRSAVMLVRLKMQLPDT